MTEEANALHRCLKEQIIKRISDDKNNRVYIKIIKTINKRLFHLFFQQTKVSWFEQRFHFRAGLPGWPPSGLWPSGWSLEKPGAQPLGEAACDPEPSAVHGRAKQNQGVAQSTAAINNDVYCFIFLSDIKYWLIFDKKRQIGVAAPALPFPFGPGPRGGVMVGWQPERLSHCKPKRRSPRLPARSSLSHRPSRPKRLRVAGVPRNAAKRAFLLIDFTIFEINGGF
ncbi:hypothetical protein P9853_00195 [Geobacillus stearothermophilus]|uniref:hypothetical protein n=1 Tax=Geobacillus TaxID=129337 RepID=UPI001E3AE9B7|nr:MULTISPECIES: hypothetical protein [Geobacillus]MED4880735.1 hypothetical protein [Geobacillus stearothermophilus]MED5010660.1 hypothetical protein [Geobacillus stearothermophilus]MED5014727.1 hypothetical protein [Geobacillus stearothermophilus]MED5043520.1 hypothetical protein [Geobacillus stearothermophilus]WJM14255.1 hypothetical protein QSJ10_15420 [Geobacillus stearothermophilus ATCC 12980]